MESSTLLLLISLTVGLARAVPVNLQEYPFSLVLYDQNNQYYGLHWNFTRETQSIHFAVNVSTTGWVGFGLSPNGQMPASDVVIGWVNGGQTYFHVSQIANAHQVSRDHFRGYSKIAPPKLTHWHSRMAAKRAM